MINGLRILGIVPARAGSKGLPGKNCRKLLGKPLVQYAFDAGLKSKYIDDVVLTSDCSECHKIASESKKIQTILRPDELAGDAVPSADVIEHTINNLQIEDTRYDLFVLLEPTSPLRDFQDVDSALEMMIKSKFQSIVSVCEAEDQHPDFMFRIENSGNLVTWSSGNFKVLRRQDVSPAYFLEGSLYISYVNSFIEKRTFCHSNTGGYIVPKWKSFEIDDIVDFVCVEAIMLAKNSFDSQDVKFKEV
jgi:N-acylneuraminate cytidylyltransferase/CMP-N,N'-diacetyllegionaminic acid synthase